MSLIRGKRQLICAMEFLPWHRSGVESSASVNPVIKCYRLQQWFRPQRLFKLVI